MRIEYPAGVLREFYERNPIITTTLYTTDGVSPHGLTTRLNYTVPAGKRARVLSANVAVMRASAATTLGKALARVEVAKSGVYAPVVAAILWNNTVGVVAQANVGEFGWFAAGDNVLMRDYDSSTGGTCDFHCGIAVMEFDA